MTWSNPKLDALAAEFFREFSRMEYALKAAGYLQNHRDAKPDWTRFADDVNEEFSKLTDDGLITAKRTLLDNPPKKQVVKQNQLDWEESIPTSQNETDLLLSYVRRVRNNLFHGGKFNNRWFAEDRSKVLIGASLTVLRSCRSASTDVQTAYDG